MCVRARQPERAEAAKKACWRENVEASSRRRATRRRTTRRRTSRWSENALLIGLSLLSSSDDQPLFLPSTMGGNQMRMCGHVTQKACSKFVS